MASNLAHNPEAKGRGLAGEDRQKKGQAAASPPTSGGGVPDNSLSLQTFYFVKNRFLHYNILLYYSMKISMRRTSCPVTMFESRRVPRRGLACSEAPPPPEPPAARSPPSASMV